MIQEEDSKEGDNDTSSKTILGDMPLDTTLTKDSNTEISPEGQLTQSQEN